MWTDFSLFAEVSIAWLNEGILNDKIREANSQACHGLQAFHSWIASMEDELSDYVAFRRSEGLRPL